MIERTFIVGGKAVEPPPGLEVMNFHDSSVHRFSGKDRAGVPVSEVILHETVTRSVETTVAVLVKRGLGVHLILGPDGRFTQHGDLADDLLGHAGRHNARSIGVELVNPYYPRLLRPDLPWSRVIEARWAHYGSYVLPTSAQAETIARLIEWVTSPASGLAIPRKWIGLRRTRLAMRKVSGAEKPSPGIYAHHYWAHADGSWLVLYAWLRLEAGLAPEAAFEEAARRAAGARGRVDLADIIRAAKALKE